MVKMKTTTAKIVALSALIGLMTNGHTRALGEDRPKNKTFEWASRLQLTRDQQKLLHLYSQLDDDRLDATKKAHLEEEIQRVAGQLGSQAVRRARPGELTASTGGHAGLSAVYNPSETNLAFTVSVKGDEEWIGSRKASMGRETYLPPKCSLIVSNLYWTTPRMEERR